MTRTPSSHLDLAVQLGVVGVDRVGVLVFGRLQEGISHFNLHQAVKHFHLRLRECKTGLRLNIEIITHSDDW